MAETTTELEVLDEIVDVLGGQSGQHKTVVPVLQQIKELLAAGITDPEDIAEAVAAWLDEHPEATTTVQDGSITDAKIADDTIPDAKLVQTGGILSAFNDYISFGEYRNVLPVDSLSSEVHQGVTWGRTKGTYTFDGTATGNFSKVLAGSTTTLPDGFEVGKTYYVESGVGDSDLQLRIMGYQSGSSSELARFAKRGTSTEPSGMFTVPSGYDGITIVWYLTKNKSVSNLTVTPSISLWMSNDKLSGLALAESPLGFPREGYVQTSNGTFVKPNSTFKEMSSYLVSGVDEFGIDFTFQESRNHAIAINVYDKDDSWLAGTMYDNSTSAASSRWIVLKSIHPLAESFVVSFRTYGETYSCTFRPMASAANTAADYSRYKYYAAQTFGKGVTVDANVTRSALGSSLLRFDKYFDHMFSDSANGTNVQVPWESLTHVRLSRRMGFRCIEANVHLLSDGNYIVIHGSTTPGYEAFGNAVEHVDGTTDISAVAFSSVSLEWVKENVRYKCVVPKYRVAPPSLHEFLRECKTLGMVPLIQAVSSDMAVLKPELDVADEIMGRDNYILYVRPDGGNAQIREYTSAPLSRWASLTSADDIEEWVSTNRPCLYGMSNYADLTDAQIQEIVEKVHAAGGLIGTAYVSEENRLRLLALGFDYFAAKYNVNEIESGNLCNLSADLSFADFSTTGTASDGILTLAAGDTVTVVQQLESAYLSGACMGIVFDGTISLDFGSFIDGVQVTSDGSAEIPFSTYFLNAAPTFTITAVTQTEVSMLTFKASKF